MKKLPLLLIVGAAVAVLSNCAPSSGLYVVNDSGEPLDGVILEPVALQYGCQCTNHTGPCGKAHVSGPQRVNLRRVDYHSILGVELDPYHPTYIQMRATGLDGRDRPYYWSGYYRGAK